MIELTDVAKGYKEKHRHIWDRKQSGQEYTVKYQEALELEVVHIELTGRPIKKGCPSCVREMFTTIYQSK